MFISRYQYYILLLSIIILFVDCLDFSLFRKIGASLATSSSRAAAMSASKYPIYCDEDVMNRKAHGKSLFSLFIISIALIIIIIDYHYFHYSYYYHH